MTHCTLHTTNVSVKFLLQIAGCMMDSNHWTGHLGQRSVMPHRQMIDQSGKAVECRCL